MHMQANGIDRSAFCLMTNRSFRARGAEVEDGAFGENLVVQGFDFSFTSGWNQISLWRSCSGNDADW